MSMASLQLGEMLFLSSSVSSGTLLTPKMECEEQQPQCSSTPPILLNPEETEAAALSLASLESAQASAAPPELCAFCGMQIYDQFLYIMDQKAFHQQCSLCHADLAVEGSCFFRDGLILCKHDYYSKYRASCLRCSLPLVAADLVMRARDATFHLSCFRCAVCDAPLQPGDVFSFSLSTGDVLCRLHLELPIVPQVSANMDDPRSKEMLNIAIDKSPTASNYDSEEQPQNGRSKRMRTSFKHHQLRTMKTYFNLNHNPDSKDLKALAIKTGLTKRVLQVWFQNARAKYRRSLNSQDGQNPSAGSIFSTTIEPVQLASNSSGSSSVSPHSPFSSVSTDFTTSLADSTPPTAPSITSL